MRRFALLTCIFSAAWLLPPQPVQAAFETMGLATRASGMGDAFVVQANGPSALWYNPAGLLAIGQRQIAVDYARLFPDLDVGPDINYWAANYVQGLAGGQLGLGVAGLSADFYTENAGVLGYARAVGSRLNIGLGLKFLSWSADGYRDAATGTRDADHSGSGLGIDLGAQYAITRWQDGTVSVGGSIRNLNEPDVSEAGGTGLPRSLTVGAAYQGAAYAGEAHIEFIDGEQRVRVGGEYRLGGRYDMRLRAGASGMPGDESAGILDGGFGLAWGKIQLDYAYRYSAQIDAGGSQRFSLGYRF